MRGARRRRRASAGRSLHKLLLPRSGWDSRPKVAALIAARWRRRHVVPPGVRSLPRLHNVSRFRENCCFGGEAAPGWLRPRCEREDAPWSPAPGPSAGPGAERTRLRNGEQSGSACWGRALGARAVTASGECLCQALCMPRRLPARVSSACFTSPREGCGICPRVRCVICPRRSAGGVVGRCARVRVPRCGRGRAALSPRALFTSTRGVPHGPAEHRRQLGLGFGARSPPPRGPEPLF